MTGDLSAAPVLLLLVFARIGAFLAVLPLTGDDLVPGRIRLLLALAVTAALTPLLSPTLAPVVAATTGGAAAWALLLVRELATGLALGMLVRVPFWAAQMAGSIASTQIGLTSAIMPDPGGGQLPALGRLVGLAALLLCLALGLHHIWFAAIVGSYELVPVGQMIGVPMATEMMIGAAARGLALAAALAGPMLAFGLLFHVMLGLISRVVPSLQIFFIAQPLLILLGLAIFGASFAALVHGFADAQADWAGRLLR